MSESAAKLVRRVGPRVVARAGELVVIGQDGRAQIMADATADVARALLAELAAPRTRAELRDLVARSSDEDVAPGGPVDQILDALLAFGVIGEVAPGERRRAARARSIGLRPRVVLGLTGAIHSLQAPSMIQALQARGMDVRVMLSRAGSRLVRSVGLEALTQHPVARSMWSRDPARPVPHLELSDWADVVVVCPASATTLARIARGDFADVVAAVALTTSAPVILAPSMNEAMLDTPAVRRNLAQLAEDGFWVVEPGEGIEVADAPDQRRPHRGTAPRADVLADVVSVVIGRARQRAASVDPPAMPRNGEAWEALWTDPSPTARAWDGAELDGASAAQLVGLAARAGSVLEIGTGSGLLAAALARAGVRVVATDVSRSALMRAAEATAGLDVTLLVDDICSSGLMGRFELVVDRACLHALPTERRAAYVATMTRLLPTGGRLAIIADAAGAPAVRATHRFDEATLRELFGASFEVGPGQATTLPHLGASSPALLFVLRRIG